MQMKRTCRAGQSRWIRKRRGRSKNVDHDQSGSKLLASVVKKCIKCIMHSNLHLQPINDVDFQDRPSKFCNVLKIKLNILKIIQDLKTLKKKKYPKQIVLFSIINNIVLCTYIVSLQLLNFNYIILFFFISIIIKSNTLHSKQISNNNISKLNYAFNQNL